jgi:hypothetical protein
MTPDSRQLSDRGCSVDQFSSAMCLLGTKSCTVDHSTRDCPADHGRCCCVDGSTSLAYCLAEALNGDTND